MKFADLHLHTIFSDGTYTPEELIAAAKKSGLDCIAVVDHDTVDGIAPTLEAAKPFAIEVIPGIELTAEYEGLEIHILGYLIDFESTNLKEKVKVLVRHRIERIYKIAEKLKDVGVNIDAQDVLDLAGGGSISRLHLARVIVAKGYASTISETFRRYIGDQCPAYVGGFRLTPYEAIKLILDAKGIPVLAHPYMLNRDELIPEFAEHGLKGLEVFYPEHSQNKTTYYKSIAQKYNLLLTGGSDCHGKAKPEVKIGSMKIPYELVERLKEEKSRL